MTALATGQNPVKRATDKGKHYLLFHRTSSRPARIAIPCVEIGFPWHEDCIHPPDGAGSRTSIPAAGGRPAAPGGRSGPGSPVVRACSDASRQRNRECYALYGVAAVFSARSRVSPCGG